MASTAGSMRKPVRLPALVLTQKLSGERLAVVTVGAAVAMLPLVVPTGPGNLAPADAFLTAALLATLLWARIAHHRWQFPFVVPVAIFMVGGALGAMVGPVPGSGLLALGQDLLLLIWCWSVVNISRSAANLRILLATWAYSSIGWVIALFIGLATGSPLLTGQIQRQGSRVAITLDDPNYAANYFVISIMIIWATRCPRNRFVRYAAVGGLLVALALTGSNSGGVALIVGSTVAALLGAYRRSGMVATVTLGAFILLAGAVIASNVSVTGIQQAASSSRYAFVRDGIGRSTSEADDRKLLFRESVNLFRTGGLLGQGPVSTKVRLAADGAPYVKEAHDDYLAALVERGLLGFVGFLLLLAGIILRTVKVGGARLSQDFSAAVINPNALVGAIAGTLLTGTVYELLHVRHVWTLFAFIAALFVWGRE